MLESPRLAAVVFDLDGLIINSEDVYEQADVEVLRRRGKVYDAELRAQMMGRPTAESLRKMIQWHALEDSVELLDAERSRLRDTLLEQSLAPMPGLLDLLAALEAARIPKAIATSGHRSYAAEVLGRLDLHARFEFVLTSEDVTHGKPAPDVYLLAAQRLGLAPAQTMVLEDSVNGCRAGVTAGAFTIAVPNRHTRGYDFTGVAFVAETLADPRITGREIYRLDSNAANDGALRSRGSESASSRDADAVVHNALSSCGRMLSGSFAPARTSAREGIVAMLRQLLLSIVLGAMLSISGGGCRSCSSCHDYDPPVANCSCGCGRTGSNSHCGACSPCDNNCPSNCSGGACSTGDGQPSGCNCGNQENSYEESYE